MTETEQVAAPEEQQSNRNLDIAAIWVGVVAAVVATIAIFVDIHQLRLAAKALLYATIVAGVVLAAWGGWELHRSASSKPGTIVWGAGVVILMPLIALVLRHHDVTVNCKDAKKLVRPTDHRTLFPAYSREEKKCKINEYIAHLNAGGTAPPSGIGKKHH
jgi:hypothetical protein